MAVIILLSSAYTLTCARKNPQPAVLVTTEPEALLWAHLYNSRQDSPAVIPQYLRTSELERRKLRKAPDLLISRHHGTPPPAVPGKPQPLSLRESLYPNIPPSPGGTALAFDLPVLVYSAADEEADGAGPLFSPREIQTLGTAFNRKNNQRYTRMGFVPLWRNSFLSSVPFLYNSGLRAASQEASEALTWREGQLHEAASALAGMVRETNGSFAASDGFIEKYLYDPPEKLLSEGRIRLYQTTLSRYAALPAGYRDSLKFGYLARREIVPAERSILYLTALSPPQKNPVIQDFCQWLLSFEGQQAILEYKASRDISRFGLAGGLSTLPRINREIIYRSSPGLQHRILPGHAIHFPQPLPSHWDQLEQEVLLPWLRKTAEEIKPDAAETGQSEDPSRSEALLQKQIEDWARSNLSN